MINSVICSCRRKIQWKGIIVKTQQEFSLSPPLANALLEGYLCLRVINNSEAGSQGDYHVVDVNKAAERMLDLTKDQVIGKTVFEIFGMTQEYWNEVKQRVSDSAGSVVFEYCVEQINRLFLISILSISQDELLVFFADTTFRHKAEEMLRIHELLFDNAQDIILYVNMEGNVIHANQRACDLYGYTKEQLLSMRIQDIRQLSTMGDFEEQMLGAEKDGIVFESIHVRSDGSEFPVEVSARTTETASGKLRIHIIRDSTERKEQQKKIAWLARYDGLTGILNRSSFLSELNMEIARAKREQTQFALLIFDIDRFKQINDTYGHAAGDYALKYLAERVQSVLRETDYFGRLGGDEFIVLQTGIKKIEDVRALILRITSSLAEPLIYQGESLQIVISLGASVFPRDATEVNELLHFADQAMYKAKRSGRSFPDLPIVARNY